jgi:sec-independent protein translocase protein TatA
LPTSLGPAEIMVILVVALIVLGPKRLPEAGRQVGKALAEVRKWSQGFQDEIRTVMEPEDTSRPSYSQPQPGYDPPPIPILPAETAAPPDEGAMAGTNGSATTTSAGSHAEIDTSSPADWTPWDRPAPTATPTTGPADIAPPEPPGPPAGEAPPT